MESGHVVILGAGFSRAVSEQMPVTDELGRRSLESLRNRGDVRGVEQLSFDENRSFESWLSLLSEDQPQLPDADNRDNAALFAHVRDAIADVLLEAESQALFWDAPLWLYEFVSALHHLRATVITLNYDVLVETTVASHSVWDPGLPLRQYVDPVDILGDWPELSRFDASASRALSDTFRLLKLHGSLDWWSVSGDTGNATLTRETTHGVFGNAFKLSPEQRRRYFPGRERFIIPPLAAKNAYYRNPQIRGLWQEAREALQGASRISLVGYSLPPADLVMADMVREAVKSGDVRVDVVNLNAEQVEVRLRDLGLGDPAVALISGDGCVNEFSAVLCDAASEKLVRELPERLSDEPRPTPLAVAWGDPERIDEAVRLVVGLSVRDGSTLELALEERVPASGSLNVRRGKNGESVAPIQMTVADLAKRIGAYDRIVATLNGRKFPIVGAYFHLRQTGLSNRWMMFVPAEHIARKGPTDMATALLDPEFT